MPQLVVGRLPAGPNRGQAIQWMSLKQWKPEFSKEIKATVPTLYSSIIRLPSMQPTEVPILTPIKPKQDQVSTAVHQSSVFGDGKAPTSLPPVILMPHGGPNGVVSTAWSPVSYAYGAAGFTLAFVN